jgi:hypothetical protein
MWKNTVDPDKPLMTTLHYTGDQKVSLHLMITIQLLGSI